MVYLLVCLLLAGPERVPRVTPTDMPPHFGLPTVARGLELGFERLPTELVEGQPVELSWWLGPESVSSELLLWATGPVVGGRDVDGTRLMLSEAVRGGTRTLAWTPPALDAVRVLLKLRAFGPDGRVNAVTSVTLPYRQAALADRREDGLLVWLTRRGGQRLYLQRDGELVFHALCSGASTAKVLRPGAHPDTPHDHHGVFKVYSKVVDHISTLNADWRMRYVMHYLAGHAIHATTPSYYRQLGRPASHGCIRLHLKEAMRLYALIPVGTRVEVF